MKAARHKIHGTLWPARFAEHNSDLEIIDLPDDEPAEEPAPSKPASKKKVTKKKRKPTTVVSDEPLDLDDLDVSDI